MLVDTSIAVALFRRVEAVVRQLAAVDTAVSSTVLGELYYGALQATLHEQELAYIAQLMATSQVLTCDAETATHYAEVRSQLRRRGTPIPENDMWIAASALQHRLPLATRDTHFSQVPGLSVEQW